MRKTFEPLARRLHLGRASKSVNVGKHNSSDILETGGTIHSQHDAPLEPFDADSTVEQAVQHAQTSTSAVPSATRAENAVSEVYPVVASAISSGPEIVNTWKPLLDNLSAFSALVETITEVHPYLKIAWSVLAAVPKAMKAQLDRDEAVRKLLERMTSVYAFLKEAKELKAHKDLLVSISQKTVECAEFIRDYFNTVEFWKRLAKNVISESDQKVSTFVSDFDSLLTTFRTQSNLHTEVIVNKLAVTAEASTAELELQKLRCATDAGRQTAKACLPDTRKEVIQEITHWMNDTSKEASRVFWLYGEAGRGKSAIAHSVAAQFDAIGRLGSCFCFDRNRTADARHEKVFTTIARDLASTDAGFRKALAEAIQKKPSIAGTSDISVQWQSLILEPLTHSTSTLKEPTSIIIDALDESGDSNSRTDLLSVLVNHTRELPSNIRILVSSRPLEDIRNVLRVIPTRRDLAQVDASDDILVYVQHRLKRFPFFTTTRCEELAMRAEGLFQWAFVACEALAGPKKAGLPPEKRFKRLLNSPAGHSSLLDGLYTEVLSQIFDVDDEDVLESFTVAMRLILTVFEPLPIAALDQIKKHSSEADASESIAPVVEFMGSLLGGTSDHATPIRLLHTSFREFLTTADSTRNPYFRVVIPTEQPLLTRSVLGVMESELQFNICRLETSYIANKSVKDLEARICQYISPQLNYASRFWMDHLGTVGDAGILTTRVDDFLRYYSLYWLEVLSLIGRVDIAYQSLLLLEAWSRKPGRLTTFQATTSEFVNLIRIFASPIGASAPHIYLSAISFIPKGSTLSPYLNVGDVKSVDVMTEHFNAWPAIQNVMQGHTDYVTSVAVSPDGTRIVSGSYDNMVRQWNAQTGEAIGVPLEGHTNWVRSVAFSPDGTRIVSGSDDTTVRQWNVQTGEAIGAPFEGHTDDVTSVAFSLDGTRIVSGSYDKTVRQWNVETGDAIGAPLEGHDNIIMTAAFSPDAMRIVSVSNDGTIRQWNALTGESIETPLKGHANNIVITSVAFSPDGTRIVSGSQDKTVQQWDAQTWEAIEAPLEGHTDWVTSVAFSPDGTRIVSGSDDKTVRQWDAQAGEAIGAALEGHADKVSSVAFSPDGTRIVSGSHDKTVRQWDAQTGEVIETLFEGHTEWVRSVAFSPDGTRIVSGSHDRTVRQWNAQTGLAIGPPLEGHAKNITSVAFSPSGTRIVSGSDDKTVRQWDAQTGEVIETLFEGHTEWVSSVAFSPDGTRIVSGSHDRTIRQWNAQTGSAIGPPLKGHAGSVTSVAFSLDGTRIVSGSEDKTVRLWNVETGEAIGAPLEGHDSLNWVTSVAFSPDGTRIVSGYFTDQTVRQWNAQTGEVIETLFEGYTGWVSSVAFSPDGTRIVSGSHDRTVRQWNAQTGLAIGPPLEGHTGPVSSVAFSRDGTRIVSGSEDKTVRLWNVETRAARLNDTNAKPADAHYNPFNPPSSSGVMSDVVQSRETTSHQITNLPVPNSASATPIRFSRDFKHSLWNSAVLFQGVDTNQDDDPRDLVRLNPDGWIVGPEGRLLLWIPPVYRDQLYTPRTEMIIGGRPVQLDLSRFPHGQFWTRCREVFETS